MFAGHAIRPTAHMIHIHTHNHGTVNCAEAITCRLQNSRPNERRTGRMLGGVLYLANYVAVKEA